MFSNKVVFLATLSCVFMFQWCYAAPDFSKIQPVKKRQQQFFSYLKPEVEKSNQIILNQRKQIQTSYLNWQKSHDLSSNEGQKLHQLAAKYGLNRLQFNHKGDWEKLLERVDIIPTSMVLAQAANESAWGTSRFARLGANYFGQWCFSKGCGIVPKQRPKGRHYAVTKFSSAYASITSYMKNLNTNSHYTLFRQLRAHARSAHRHPKGYQLAQGLGSYSQRGASYIASIRAIISRHHLEQYDIA